MVGVRGLEPPASSSQTTRASQLRHTPIYDNALRFHSGHSTTISIFTHLVEDHERSETKSNGATGRN